MTVGVTILSRVNVLFRYSFYCSSIYWQKSQVISLIQAFLLKCSVVFSSFFVVALLNFICNLIKDTASYAQYIAPAD